MSNKNGILLECGKDHYNFDPKEEQSYYLKYRNGYGEEKVLWGVDFERAIEESDVQIGQKIQIENLGKKPVTIEVPVRDAEGNFVFDKEGQKITESKVVERNAWRVTPFENLEHESMGREEVFSPEIDMGYTEEDLDTNPSEDGKKDTEEETLARKRTVHQQEVERVGKEGKEQQRTERNDEQVRQAQEDKEEQSLDLKANGSELDRESLILPRQITQSYVEKDGKFYSKGSNVRVMFEDKGEKITTSTTDKKAIEDMVAYAKAKQWKSLKLTGSKEFRKEAWLQAESQGIQTAGYTPKAEDLVELEQLREKRSINSISPIEQQEQKPVIQAQEQKTAAVEKKTAERHLLDKDQASMHIEAQNNLVMNVRALTENHAFHDRSREEIAGLAYWRGVVASTYKENSEERKAALGRFDEKAKAPSFLTQLNKKANIQIDEKMLKEATRSAGQQQPEHSL